MSINIENADCMVQAVASVVSNRPDAVELLRPLRQKQLETDRELPLDPEKEKKSLLELFDALDVHPIIITEMIQQVSELDALLSQGRTILLGLPRDQDSHQPHIVHLREKIDQPQIINGDRIQLGRRGYLNAKEFLSQERIQAALMGQASLPVFIINNSE